MSLDNANAKGQTVTEDWCKLRDEFVAEYFDFSDWYGDPVKNRKNVLNQLNAIITAARVAQLDFCIKVCDQRATLWRQYIENPVGNPPNRLTVDRECELLAEEIRANGLKDGQ